MTSATGDYASITSSTSRKIEQEQQRDAACRGDADARKERHLAIIDEFRLYNIK